ncbi:MAG: bifunctional riboflavin kinase/FAD synthetase [Planctomycetota bacterium]
MPLPAPLVFGSPSCTPPLAGAAVAVGNFDGVHLGHAAIARRLVAAARERGVPAVALTFDPHPASIVRPGAAPPPLTTPARRAELLLALGLDAVLVQPADAALVALGAEEFYREVLRERLGAVAIVEGEDFRFGAGRRGDVQLLRALAAADAVAVEVVPPVLVGAEPVSSSRLRALVAAGDVAEAARLATSAYRLTGEVVTGAGRGAGLGFPTANLAGIATLLPAGGVYAAVAAVATGERHWLPAAVNVGPAPTFGVEAATVEVHLVGFTGDLYGRTLDVDFLARLRDTRRFASVADLKTQLAADVARAAAIAGPVASAREA